MCTLCTKEFSSGDGIIRDFSVSLLYIFIMFAFIGNRVYLKPIGSITLTGEILVAYLLIQEENDSHVIT